MIKKLKYLFEENMQWIFYLFIGAFTVIVFLRVDASKSFYLDTVEHIHASWLVSEGQVPFRDFFEHHNPLLWYMLAPLTQIFARDAVIIPIVRSLAVIGYLLCIWMIYKIAAKYVYSKIVAQISVLLLMAIALLWKDIANMRPDIFMHLFFFMALYNFFAYLTDKKRWKLVVSYICCSISFLFLQKAVFLGLGFAVANLWLLYKKEVKIRDFIYAVVSAFIPLLIFMGYLIHTQSLADWFYYNFIFNMNLQEYYADYNNGGSAEFKWFVFFSILAIVRFYKFTTNSFVVLMCAITVSLSFISFAPHPQYYQGYFFLAAILLGEIIYKNKFSGILYCLLMFSILFSLYTLCPNTQDAKEFDKIYNKASFVIKNSTPQDQVLDLGSQVCNLFNPDIDYYWFGFYNVSIIDTIYNPERYLDVDALIKEKKPKFICAGGGFAKLTNDRVVEYHLRWFNMRANKLLIKAAKHKDLLNKMHYLEDDFWQIDEQWLKEHYIKHEDVNIYELIN